MGGTDSAVGDAIAADDNRGRVALEAADSNDVTKETTKKPPLADGDITRATRKDNVTAATSPPRKGDARKSVEPTGNHGSADKPSAGARSLPKKDSVIFEVDQARRQSEYEESRRDTDVLDGQSAELPANELTANGTSKSHDSGSPNCNNISNGGDNTDQTTQLNRKSFSGKATVPR